MAPMAQQIADMVDMLPTQDQELAYEIIKKLVLAWDPDFTKLTPKEQMELEAAEAGEYVDASEIDWDAE